MRIQTLARSLAATTGLALVLMASPAQAQLVTPGSLINARDSAGNLNRLSIDNPNGTTANVTVLSPVVVSDWFDFNVPQNTTLNLGSATGTSSLLARVVGGSFSDMGGTVNANDVNLWLINQNGILFGSNSAINTGSFVASTLDVADEDFFDFYSGTNVAGNGANTVRFTTHPGATTIIASPAGAKFAAQRGLLFVSPSLDLSGNFNAGSGAASFVAATDVSVNFSAGSPLSYTVNKGTTVATQAIAGSVTGREAQFIFRNASTLSNGMLTINADVATTATATARGILLSTSSEAGKDAAVTADGALTSTGSVSADVAGDLRFSKPLSGSALTLTASKALVAGNVSATAGGVAMQGSSNLSAGHVNATGNISYSTHGIASFNSLSSTGGTVGVSNFAPSGLSIAGNVTGTSVYLLTNGALSVGNVTSTAGNASVLAYGAGSIAAGNVSAAGGNVDLVSVGSMTAGALTATGSILAQSGNGGTVSLGNLDAGSTITLDTTGSLALGSARAGGTFKTGSLVDPSSVTASGPIVASDVDIDSIGAMSLGNVTATGGNIDLDAGGVLTGGALSATGLISVDTPGAVQLASILANSDGIGAEGVTVGTTIMPSSITVTGATSGGSVRLATSGAMQLGNVSSTAGAVDLDSSNGGISAGAVSATGGNAMLTAPGAITTSSIGSSAAVDVDSTGGGNLNLGSLNAGTTINLDSSGSARFGSATAGGAFAVGASVDPSSITATGNISAASIDFDATGLLNAQNIAATAGGIDIDTGSVLAGALSATNGVAVDAAGAVALTSVSGDSDSNGAGLVVIGGVTTPSALTISGITKGVNAVLRASGAVSLGNVTSTSGVIDIDSINGAISTGALSATGGDALVTARGGVTTGSIASTSGAIDVDSTNGGALNLGNLTAGTTVALGTSGTLTAGSVNAGGAFSVGGSLTPSALILTGNATASSIYLHTFGALTAQDLTATAGGMSLYANSIDASDLLASGSLVFGTSNSGDATFDSLVSTGGVVGVSGVIPHMLTVNGEVRGTTTKLYGIDGIQVGNVTATLGLAYFYTERGGVVAGNVSATSGDVTIASASGVGVGNIAATGAISARGNGDDMTLGNLSAGTGVALDTVGALSFGSVTAPTAQLFIGGSNQPSSITSAGVINVASLTARTTGALSLTGANAIGRIDNVTAGGSLLINNAIDTTIAGTVTGASDVTVKSGGDLTIASTGGVTGGLVALSAVGNFINDSESDAVTASDHWVVYSNAPAGNFFGGLDSGNTALWNATLATRAPGTISGNRYVFAYQPTLTVASTDATKVYGTDLTGSLNGYYTASGLQPGVAGAYQADTLAGILSGTPTISSAGAVANADVAGSPYAMNIAQGSLGVGNGYALVLTSTGKLTVTPKAITATIGANDKTYDGTTAATGSVTLNGTLAGDDIGTGGTSFTFSDKNAGTDKTVTVSGTTLTGADAGNYTLTVPATTLADIFAKAINASVAANSKTYDGTTAATGSVTLNGVVAGDSVGTSGTVFAFSDKNAGINKTVTITGTTLTGADAGNYTLDIPASTLADIFAKAISAAVAANSKTYDGTTAATGSVTLSGVIAGDSVGTAGTVFTFGDKNVGKDKAVTVAGTTLTGADAGNYTLTLPATTLADIFAKAITATVAANNKTYDGTTAATGTVTLNGVVAGDSVGTTGAVFTFSDRNAGTNKAVSVKGTTLTGADAGNYTVAFPTSTLASILQRALQITADDQVKFRNNPDPALTYNVGGQGLVAGDTLSGALTREPGETLGNYAINQGTLSASANYAVSYAPGTLSIVRDPVADAAAAGQNALRALPLPSDTVARRGAVLVVDADGLCPPEDKDCRVR